MTKEKMTVHKALAEMKTIDSRIYKKINEAKFCVSNRHSNQVIGGEPINVFKDKAKADYQAVVDLINRRNAIKRAICRSNANTIVKINGDEYTVVEAIDMKNHGTDLLIALASALTRQYSNASQKCQSENVSLPDKADNFIASTFGVKDDKRMTADSADLISKQKKEYITNNTFEIVDPISADQKASQYMDEAQDFLAEVDAALSVSNAITEIEIEY